MVHICLKFRIDHRLVADRIIAQMNTLRCIRINTRYDILIDFFRHERNHRSRELGKCDKACVQRHVRIDLVLLHALCPEAAAAAADVPVGQVVNKCLQSLAGFRNLIGCHVRIHLFDGGVQAGKDPFVNNRKLIVLKLVVIRVKVVNICIQHVERIGVPKRAEESSLSFHNGLAIETARQPRSGVDDEIPADRVSAVLSQSFHRIDGIALGLAHLLTVLILYEAENDNVLEARLMENERRDRMQRIEPSACLVDSLGNEACRELCLKELLILERIMMLCERHGAGVEPAVDNFRYTVHCSAAVRAFQSDSVDKRLMQLDIVRAVVAHFLQFGLGSDCVLMAAVIADPYRKRSSPVAVTGKSPVLDIFKPVAETAFADALRDPVDLLIIGYQFILDLSHADEPGFTRIVDERCAASPAVRIVVLELRSSDQKSSCAEIFQNFRICADRAFLHFLLGRLAAHAGERRLLRHLALLIDELDERQIIIAADSGIVFTECRSNMYDTCTVCHGYIIVAGHKVSLLALLLCNLAGTLIKRLIFPAFKILTDIFLQDLDFGVLAEDL